MHYTSTFALPRQNSFRQAAVLFLVHLSDKSEHLGAYLCKQRPVNKAGIFHIE